MALTQVSSKGIKDATLLNEDINASADIAGSKLADNSISLAKLLHGDSNNNGKFLRANNGADPTFESVITDLVGDSSPQLGGNLDTNGNDIVISDGEKLSLHTYADVRTKTGATNAVVNGLTGHVLQNSLVIEADHDIWLSSTTGKKITFGTSDGAVHEVMRVQCAAVGASQHGFVNLNYVTANAGGSASSATKLATTSTGVTVTGALTATSFIGDGSNLTGISAGTALSGSTNNTICTVTGANAIQGEANFTFDGSSLGVGIASPTFGSGTGLHLRGTSGGQTRLHMTTSSSGDAVGDGFDIVALGAESGGSGGMINMIQYEPKDVKFTYGGTTDMLLMTPTGAVNSYHNGSKKFETTSYGTKVTGYQSASAYVGFHVQGSLSDHGYGTNHGSGITSWDVSYYSPIPMWSSRTIDHGSSYLSFPSYAGGNYVKFTAPVAGLYMLELLASVETHHGGDWCQIGWEINTETANNSSNFMNNNRGVLAVYERAGGDEGMGCHFSTTIWMAANDYAVLYQQSTAAVRWKGNQYYVRGHLI